MTTSSEYDVTGNVRVSDPDAVCAAVVDVLSAVYPDASLAAVQRAFVDFRRMFEGEMPGFMGCDTVYHDMQHSLDVTLAMTRLMAGHEKANSEGGRLGYDLVSVGVVAALFHDSGYIQREGDENHVNGAQYTKYHISRGVEFLTEYLPRIGLGDYVTAATEVLHFTGYERPLDTLAPDSEQQRTLGKLLGTADLVAQMSDRCYLEKCRDRLYSEFVLGGVAFGTDMNGSTEVQYQSGEDLLRKTPEFFESVAQARLDGDFDKSYVYFESWFDGKNPYLEAIQRNLEYLHDILADGDWSRLRRAPPVFTSQEDSLSDTQEMVAQHIQKMFGGAG